MMKNNSTKLAVIIFLVAAVLLPCSFAAVSNPAAALALVKTPANNPTQEIALNAGLVKAGPDAITQICDLIVPPGTGDDTKARYVIGSLVYYASRPGADAEKKMYSAVLTKALTKATDKEVKSFFIAQLQYAGTTDCIGVVSKYLADERLCEPASLTLQAIGTKASEKAILKVLPTATQKTLPTIIYALGQMRVKDAVSRITKSARSRDRTIRLVSLAALAKIGDPASMKVFDKVMKVKDPYERCIGASFYVTFAKRLQETGYSKDAILMYKYVLRRKDPAITSSVKASALGLLVDALGTDAGGLIEGAFDSGDDQLQAAAMTLAAKMSGSSVTKMWCEKLKDVSPARQVKIIEMLGTRGDKAALVALQDAYKGGNNEVKCAILNAFGNIDKAVSLQYLFGAIGSDQKELVTAATSLLMQLPTKYYAVAAYGLMSNFPPAGQVALIEILAERRFKMFMDTIFSYTSSKDESVRIAATKALTNLAGPADLGQIIDLMLNAKTPRQRSEASRVVVLVSSRIEDGSVATKALLGAMKGATKDQQISIIKLLSSVGTKAALDIVVRETKSSDSDLSDTAIRTLVKWKNVLALDALLDVASTTKQLNYHVIALKAYVTLVARGEIPPARKAVNFKKALEVARRPEEKKFIVSRLSQVKAVETLAIAVELLDDKALAADATRAVVNIALPAGKKNKGLKAPGVGRLLLDAYTEIADPAIRKIIDTHIKTLAKEKYSNNDLSTQKQAPEGFVSLFNGKNLSGWKGLMSRPNDNPAKRAKLGDDEYAKQQAIADNSMRKHWHVVDGVLYFDGGKGGHSLATGIDFGDFEMLVDWKLMHANGDSGIYLRGSPQVQIWDPTFTKVGSGGLFNNKKNPSKPIVTADKPIGQWNTFRIKMVGDKVTVHLNGKLVVDNVTLENYWDRKQSIFSREQIELQCHNNPVCFRNIFIREIPRPDDFVYLFYGSDLSGWIGDTEGYIVEDGKIVCKPGGNLYTANQYSDFVLRFEFKLESGTNNGLGIRTKVGVNAAYDGMELQILDNSAKKYKDKLKEYQYHGSIYGVVPAKRGFLKPVGQWNTQEVTAKGNKIIIILNGEEIVNADIKEAAKDGTMDNRPHPGLFNKTGHIGFLGHGSVVEFKDIRIKELR